MSRCFPTTQPGVGQMERTFRHSLTYPSRSSPLLANKVTSRMPLNRSTCSWQLDDAFAGRPSITADQGHSFIHAGKGNSRRPSARGLRTRVWSLLSSPEAPAPVLFGQNFPHATIVHQSPARHVKETEWIAWFQPEAFLLYGLQFASPQGVLGPACFMEHSTPPVGAKEAALPVAPPLRGETIANVTEELKLASCLATPTLLQNEQHFRRAHVEHLQRLAQQTEVAVQMRYAKDLRESEKLEGMKAALYDQAPRIYRSFRRLNYPAIADLSDIPEEMVAHKASLSAAVSSYLDPDMRQVISNVFDPKLQEAATQNTHVFKCGARSRRTAAQSHPDGLEVDFKPKQVSYMALIARERCQNCRMLHYCNCRGDAPLYY
eukprot:jgi/Botrbrau1/7883/Bobra.9_2s0057.1